MGGLSLTSGLAFNNQNGLTWTVGAGKATHTGDTNATDIATVTVPGGSLGTKGYLKILPLYDYPNNANNKIMTILVGGTTFFSNTQTTTAIGQPFVIVRSNASESAQVGFFSGTFSSFGAVAAAEVTATINTASDFDVVFRVQLGSAADTIQLWYAVEAVYVR